MKSEQPPEPKKEEEKGKVIWKIEDVKLPTLVIPTDPKTGEILEPEPAPEKHTDR